MRDTLGGFTVGDLFTGNGQPGQIARLSNNGQTVQNPWVVLTPETGLLRGSLYVDRTGVFGGDLIVVTTAGGVWRINAAQQATRLATLGVHLEGVITVPDDARYGAWRGKILAGAEDQQQLWTIDPQGTAVPYSDLSIRPEDIDLIPANENFFGVDYGNSRLVGAPASAFSNWVGDIAIAEEGTSGNPAILWRVWWDGSAWQKQALAQVGQWEHMTFSSAGLPPIPPIPTNTPTLTRTPTNTLTPTATPTFACSPGPYWCISSSKNSNPGDNALYSVSAFTQNDVWAAGQHTQPTGTPQTLIEHWDGSSWNFRNPPQDIGAANAIIAVSASEAWAASNNAMIHWTGSAWGTPYPGVSGVKSLAAFAPTDVYAAGGSILQRWNGTLWQTVTPVPSGRELNGVGVASVGATGVQHLWTVGTNGQGLFSIHWDALSNAWTTPVVPTPPAASSSTLKSVAILNDMSAWAVGYYIASLPGGPYRYTLIEYWDGSSWRVVPSPNLGPYYNELRSVWVTRTGDVWAAGTWADYPSGTRYTLVLHWNGRQWVRSISPNQSGNGELWAITSHSPAMSDWAAGSYIDQTLPTPAAQTLVEYITAPTPPALTRSYYEELQHVNYNSQRDQGVGNSRQAGSIPV